MVRRRPGLGPLPGHCPLLTRSVAPPPPPGDTNSLLSGLSGEQAETVRRYLDERDTLMLLHGSIAEVELAESLMDRLQVFVHAIQRTGFARVVLTVRDGSMEPTLVVSAGLSGEQEEELRLNSAPGEVWRRRLALLEPYRLSQSYYLDFTDEWIAREFGGGVPSTLRPSDDPTWTPRDSLLVLLKARDGRILATLGLDDPLDRRRPSLSRIRIVELFGHQIAWTDFHFLSAANVDLRHFPRCARSWRGAESARRSLRCSRIAVLRRPAAFTHGRRGNLLFVLLRAGRRLLECGSGNVRHKVGWE